MNTSQQSDYNDLLTFLRNKGYSGYTWVHRELKYLSKNLLDDECVYGAVKGYFNDESMLCTITNKRILFLNVKLFTGVQSIDIPLNLVNAVSLNSGLSFAQILITNGAQSTIIKGVYKNMANLFVQDVRTQLDELRKKHQNDDLNKLSSQGSSNTLNDLIKLKKLYTDGFLTEDEFMKEKNNILNK